MDFVPTDELRARFARDGMLVIPGFFDIEREIRPIQRAIYDIIGLVAARHGIALVREPFSAEQFDAGYAQLTGVSRAFGGEVYDQVKQIPAFLRLISSEKGEALFKFLRGTDVAGIGTASYGIRIDSPQEEQFRSHWHQEFIFQPQSVDGIVMWSPLRAVTREMGPVEVCRGSHRDGIRKCSKTGVGAAKSGAYKIGMVDDEKVVAAYERCAPLTRPGDLIVLDFLVIHQSGYNVSDRPRWSVQSRFFNFRDPYGARLGWKASVTAGTEVEALFAEYFAEE
ncbi:phytanoyl-CoA dioxygenase family protein [Cupriavidus sp. 2TAF22]|uniref:phytanoyl-CoA dioxygenase family protein n=1 Tax=unclassified Cupriavidus TaxID=2640874 RepID=UPI003F925A59